MDIEERAAQLREELRNERNGANERNRSISKGSRGSDASIRPNSQDTRANTAEAITDAGDASGDNRGTEIRAKRIRSNRRRPIDDGGRIAEGSSQATKFGLERGDNFDLKPPDGTIGKSRKSDIQETVNAFKHAIFRKKGSTLSEKEAKEYRDILPKLVQGYGETVDQALVAFCHCQMPLIGSIWGNIADIEATALSNILIKRGMRNAQAAEVVRKMVSGEDYIMVGVMFAPRIQMTVEGIRAGRVEE